MATATGYPLPWPPSAGRCRSTRRRLPARTTGRGPSVIWIILLILLIAVFGLGTLLEAAFWTLLIIGVVVVAAVVGLSRLVRR